MKKIIAILLIITAGAAVFAGGAQETNEDGVVELERGQLARNSFIDGLEKIERTGTLKFESPVPELVSGGTDYTLCAPGAGGFLGYVSEGDKLTVHGYLIDDEFGFFGQGRGCFGVTSESEAVSGNTRLLVESVEIDGTTYELPWVNDDFGGRGMQGGKAGRSRMDFRGGNMPNGRGGFQGQPGRGYGLNNG